MSQHRGWGNGAVGPGAGWTPREVFVDVDGVMTTGQFFYSSEGKVMKVFGPDDHDGLLLLREHVPITFLTGDRKGLEITKKRIVDDMKFPLELVSTIRRLEWIRERVDPKTVIYMGDGIFDHYVFAEVGYGVCPSDGFYLARRHAHFVTNSPGGQRAVAEACLHILEKFFERYDPAKLPTLSHSSGEWS